MDKLTLKIEYSDFLDKFLINYLEKCNVKIRGKSKRRN